jgi:hypothetical protein
VIRERLARALVRFHRDERGMETLQVVMIVAIAAIITAFLQRFWPSVKHWFRESVDQVLRWQG